MTLENFESLAAVIESIVTAVALGGGGWWAYSKFILQREHSPRVDFDVDVEFLGKQQKCWLVSLMASLDNRGLVRHHIENFDFELRCLCDNDTLEIAVGKDGHIHFPKQLASGSWLRGHAYTFVEPGTKALYRYLVPVPEQVSFLALYGSFSHYDYGDTLLFTRIEAPCAFGHGPFAPTRFPLLPTTAFPTVSRAGLIA